jgi:DNA replication protein DnaC
MDELPKPVSSFLPEVKKQSREMECKAHGMYASDGYTLGRHTHWTQCPECARITNEQNEAAQVRLKAEEEQARIESKMNRSGIPIRYRDKDFASFIADTDAKEKVRAIAMEFANGFDEHYRKGTVMVFSGPPGTGKSHLAIAIAQEVMMRRTALYASAIDAIRMVRDTWRKGAEKTESQVLDMLTSIHLLVLDEIGVQYGTDAEKVTLFDIIDKRYRDMMPTILLTNQNKAGMKEYLGERSFDRLREGGIWVTLDWASKRGSA